jgi:hypothetical protein
VLSPNRSAGLHLVLVPKSRIVDAGSRCVRHMAYGVTWQSRGRHVRRPDRGSRRPIRYVFRRRQNTTEMPDGYTQSCEEELWFILVSNSESRRWWVRGAGGGDPGGSLTVTVRNVQALNSVVPRRGVDINILSPVSRKRGCPTTDSHYERCDFVVSSASTAESTVSTRVAAA